MMLYYCNYRWYTPTIAITDVIHQLLQLHMLYTNDYNYRCYTPTIAITDVINQLLQLQMLYTNYCNYRCYH